jgi:hypothetical protein
MELHSPVSPELILAIVAALGLNDDDVARLRFLDNPRKDPTIRGTKR